MSSGPSDISTLFGVEGLVVVITGGGSGVGLLLTQALESNGATVYIIGRRQNILDEAASTAKHGKIIPIQGSVTSKDDLQRAVDQITSETGYVNVVIANAGIEGPPLKGLPQDASVADLRKHFWNWDTEAFNDAFAVNATAVFNTAAAFLELLDEGNKRGNLKQKSQIIATSSIGGFNRMPLAGFAYGASKAAVTHIVKQLATYLGPHGIRANVIAPGFYPSDMTVGLVEKYGDGEWPKSLVPEGRPGDADDIGGAILFLVSKAGAYINGNVLLTDGGRLSIMPSTY